MTTTYPVHHHFVPADGHSNIHVIEFGTGSSAAPPMILLHGVTGSGWLWHDVAQALATDRQVLAMDLRGHGESAWSAEHQYTSAAHAVDLKAVIDAFAPHSQVDLCGLSWGGLISIQVAVDWPTRVRRLAIVDVEASFSQSETQVAPRPRHFADLSEVIEWERKANPAAPDALLSLVARQSVVAASGGWTRRHDPYFFERWPFRADDCWEQLPKLSLPVQLVHGGRSFVRGEVMQQMGTKITQSTYAEIANSGHLVPLEAPEELAICLKEFFSQSI